MTVSHDRLRPEALGRAGVVLPCACQVAQAGQRPEPSAAAQKSDTEERVPLPAGRTCSSLLMRLDAMAAADPSPPGPSGGALTGELWAASGGGCKRLCLCWRS